MNNRAIRTVPWKVPLPPEAEAAVGVVRALREAGHEAWLVGGAVRDLVLGLPAGDWDVATSATAEEVAALLPRCELVGESFGVTLVKTDNGAVETATFRAEGAYSDGRHPDRVRMPVSLTEDSRRRDFTVNALYLDPLDGRMVDPQDGLADCRARVLRCVGDAAARFGEDSLRLLRAARLAAQAGLTVEPATRRAMRACREGVRRVAAERIGQEIRRILIGPDPAFAFEILAESGLLAIIVPEVEALRGLPQPPDFHPEGDVWQHTLAMLRHSPSRSAALGLAILLHDVGKAATITESDRIRFHGHAEEGAGLVPLIGRRLRLPGSTVDTAADLVRRHMHFLNVRMMRESTLRRFLRGDHFDELLELHRLDRVGSNGDLESWEFCRDRLAGLDATELHPRPLLNGGDLLAMGYEAGPGLGLILRQLEDAQLEGRVTDAARARQWLAAHHPLDASDDEGQ